MTRRLFCSLILFCSWLVGCTKPKTVDEGGIGPEVDLKLRVYTGPTPIDPVERIAGRIGHHLDREGYTFDPITLTILGTILGGILRYCLDRIAVNIQSKVRKKPDGVTAVRLRGKLRRHYHDAKSSDGSQLFNTAEDVDDHVEGTMFAFTTATPDELRNLIKDLRDQPATNFPNTSFRSSMELREIE